MLADVVVRVIVGNPVEEVVKWVVLGTAVEVVVALEAEYYYSFAHKYIQSCLSDCSGR